MSIRKIMINIFKYNAIKNIKLYNIIIIEKKYLVSLFLKKKLKKLNKTILSLRNKETLKLIKPEK